MKPRHLLIVVAALLVSVNARAQDVFPVGVTPPTFIVPASGVAGDGTVIATQLKAANGSAALPSITFGSTPTYGFYDNTNRFDVTVAGQAQVSFDASGTQRQLALLNGTQLSFATGATPGNSSITFLASPSAGKLTLTGTTPMLQLGGTTSGHAALKDNGGLLQVKQADDSAFVPVQVGGVSIGFTVLVGIEIPTISSGFGTSPSVIVNNGTAAFTINVGTGGVATSGVIGLRAATTGWNCFATDRTTNVVTRETATTTTTVTLTAASAWAASDILQVSCFAY